MANLNDSVMSAEMVNAVVAAAAAVMPGEIVKPDGNTSVHMEHPMTKQEQLNPSSVKNYSAAGKGAGAVGSVRLTTTQGGKLISCSVCGRRGDGSCFRRVFTPEDIYGGHVFSLVSAAISDPANSKIVTSSQDPQLNVPNANKVVPVKNPPIVTLSKPQQAKHAIAKNAHAVRLYALY